MSTLEGVAVVGLAVLAFWCMVLHVRLVRQEELVHHLQGTVGRVRNRVKVHLTSDHTDYATTKPRTCPLCEAMLYQGYGSNRWVCEECGYAERHEQ